MNQLEEEYAMRRKKFFACASAIWAVLLVVLMATSAMAINQTSRSEEMIANSTCDFAGSTTYIFTQDDYNIIVAYLNANEFVQIRAALNGTDIDPSSDVPVLCEPITNPLFDGTGLGAMGGDIPDDLVVLDTLGVEVSDMSNVAGILAGIGASNDGAAADTIPDVTAYVYGADGSQIITIYITDIQAADGIDNSGATTDWEDASNFPWVKIGLWDEVGADGGTQTAQVGDDEFGTAICADVHDFGGLSKLTLSTDFDPVTLTVTGSDNEIGHFIVADAFVLADCADDKAAPEFCDPPTTEIELCAVAAQGCPPTNFYCFKVTGTEWPDSGMIDVVVRSNGAADGATDQAGVYFEDFTLRDEDNVVIIPSAVSYLSAGGAVLAQTAYDDCDDYQWQQVVITFDAADIVAAGINNNELRVCIDYLVNPDEAVADTDVRFWTQAGTQPCGSLWPSSMRTAAGLVECGGLSDSLYFPYVITGSAPWGAGIATVNLGYDGTNGVAPADMEVMVTVTDSTGTECTMTKDDFTTTTWNTMVEDIVADLSCTPAAGAAWMDITSNFTIDGWLFFTDGNGFAGSNARLDGADDDGQ